MSHTENVYGPAPIPEARRAHGQYLRAQRAARVRLLRRRLATGAVVLFLAAWALIALVLITGHDPALAQRASSAATVPAATTSASAATASPAPSSGATPTATNNSSSGSSTSNGSGAVTTRQS